MQQPAEANYTSVFTHLIQTGGQHLIDFENGKQDLGIFKDCYLYKTGLQVKYFSHTHGDLMNADIQTIRAIDKLPLSRWLIKISNGPAAKPAAPARTAGLVLTPERSVFTVSEITRRIKAVLTSGEFANIWVCGEISGLKLHTSGHAYFSLKDEKAVLRGVMFRQAFSKIKFKPENGLKVEAYGSIGLYEPSGQHQLTVQRLIPEGKGELQLAFEQLKKRLHHEGLFSVEAKQALPRFPQTIGIVTSPTSAALRDMVKTIKKSYERLHLIIYAAKVQGAGAAEEIAEMVAYANQENKADVLIVGRGGGSTEDLWCFNEEVVARAIFQSRIPVISAVGHEVDYTIADFTADYRAATPTAAAEKVTENYLELMTLLPNLAERLIGPIRGRILQTRARMEKYEPAYLVRALKSNLESKQQLADELSIRLDYKIKEIFKERSSDFLQLAAKLNALSPFNVLSRGYSLVKKENTIIKEAGALKSGDTIQITFYKGEKEATVK